MRELLKNNIEFICLGLMIILVQMPGALKSLALLPGALVLVKNRGLLSVEKELKIILMFFLGYVLLFSIISIDFSRSIKGFYDVLRGLIFFPAAILFVKQVEEDPRRYRFVNFMAFGLIFGSFLFPQNGFWGYYINPNNVAVALSFLLLFCLPYSLESAFWSPQYLLHWGAGAVGLYLLILTNGRGAWLGLTCAFLTFFLFRTKLKTWVRSLGVVIVTTGLGILIFYFNLKGSSLRLREGLWKGLYEYTITESPFWGFGFNTVKNVIDELGLITRTAHNLELEVFVSSGILGLLIIAFIIFRMFRFFLSKCYADSVFLNIGVMGLVLFIVMGQFDLKLSSYKLIATFSLFIGFIYSQAKTCEKVKTNE